jgi:2-dehydro-3-deoxyglucarate aldolase
MRGKRLSQVWEGLQPDLKNSLKAKMKKGEVTIGTTISIGHPDIAETLGQVGYDWILIDTEHAPLEVGTVQNLMQAMSGSKSVPIVRVAWNDMVMIKRALDIGAYGIIVPWVNTKEEAERAVQAIRYPPRGLRGFGPRRASLFDPEYVATAENELVLAVQIETKKAIDNLDEILSVEGIDAAVIGPADLSFSLGMLMQYDNPKFNAALDKVVAATKKHHVAAGFLAVDNVERRVKQGFTWLNVSADLGLLKSSAKKDYEDAVKGAKAAKNAKK